MIKRVIMICCLFLSGILHADGVAEEQLFRVAKGHLSKSHSVKDIRDSIKLGLWNEDKSAVVITFNGQRKTSLFMFIPDKENGFKIVDIGGVEDGNLGKIGIAGRGLYSKIRSTPIEWVEMNEDDERFYLARRYRVNIRTRAWKDGQRYTVYELLSVTADGEPLFR